MLDVNFGVIEVILVSNGELTVDFIASDVSSRFRIIPSTTSIKIFELTSIEVKLAIALLVNFLISDCACTWAKSVVIVIVVVDSTICIVIVP